LTYSEIIDILKKLHAVFQDVVVMSLEYRPMTATRMDSASVNQTLLGGYVTSAPRATTDTQSASVSVSAVCQLINFYKK